VFAIGLAAEAVKWPVVAPFAISRPEGTVKLALLLPIESTVQPTDARFSVTVHVLAAPPVKLAGVQLMELGTVGSARVIAMLPELPPRRAVTVADWLLDNAAVVALKVAEDAAGATVTDAGTVRFELVSIRVTIAPEAGAGPLSVTVQVELLKGFRVAGRQDREVTAGNAATTETVPLAAKSGMPVPAGEDAVLLITTIGTVFRPAAIVRFTTATTPFEMIPVFIAEATQVYVPGAPLQVNVLPAAVRAAPELTETEATLAVG
jgi:hypothetical protein